MAITLNATPSCNNGSGVILVTWSSDQSQSYQVELYRSPSTFIDSEGYPASESGQHEFANLADGTYYVRVEGSIDGVKQVNNIVIDCTVPISCDLEITGIATTQATAGQNDGTATINATGTGTIEYSINGAAWQTSSQFSNLAAGVYTAAIRQQTNTTCGDEGSFEITVQHVSGCTNPEADNYNPNATQDDGTCTFTSKFYPCGGTLPNPVFVGLSFSPFEGPEIKQNHYAKINIYKTGQAIPFASHRQTLRNGKASADISTYLKTQFDNTYTEPGPEAVQAATGQSFGFHLGIIEYYNGTEQPEALRILPEKIAVNAAVQDYPGTLEPYIVR
jgi:hypothetical protein